MLSCFPFDISIGIRTFVLGLSQISSFFSFNMNAICSNIHKIVYENRHDFVFPIVNFPWLSGDVPRLPLYGIYISQYV